MDEITKRIVISLLAGLLMAMASIARGEPVSANFDYTCVFPLLEEQAIKVHIDSDMPSTVTAGQSTGAFDIQATATVSTGAWNGLDFVGTHTLKGSVSASASVSATGLELPLTLPLSLEDRLLPDQAGPFTMSASGSTPALTFGPANAGDVTIRVGDLVLALAPQDNQGQPTGLGQFESECRLDAGQDGVLHRFTVVVPPAHPQIDVSPGTLSFDQVQIGLNKTLAVTVRNVGGAALGISSIELDGPDSSQFLLSHDCTTLLSGDQCQVQVTFVPNTDGNAEATLRVHSDDPQRPDMAVAVTGSGQMAPRPHITSQPSSLDFKQVGVGQTKQQTLLLANAGTDVLLVSSVTLSGGDAQLFSQQNLCSAIDPNGSCEVTVSFTPDSPGDKAAELVIASSDPDQPLLNVPVSGSGQSQQTDLDFQLSGESSLQGRVSLPLDGHIRGTVDATNGLFSAQMEFEPSRQHVRLVSFLRSVTLDADFLLQPVNDVNGSLTDSIMHLQFDANLQLSNLKLRLFGVPLSLGKVGQCRTRESAHLSLATPTGEDFDMNDGRRLTGRYAMPPLSDCGVMTDVINLLVAGANNSITLMMSPPSQLLSTTSATDSERSF
ncbi:choice-of-anchor D domain-containing protein [Alcanivorax hongdengensis]|nr:choice-of-anchor D domain-containing protein [Alcanivorax hongdengensis]